MDFLDIKFWFEDRVEDTKDWFRRTGDSFVGNDENRKALAIQRECEKRLDQAIKRVDAREKELLGQLENTFKQINRVKRKILMDSFKDFYHILSQVKDVTIPDEISESVYQHNLKNADAYTAVFEEDKQRVVDFSREKGKTIAKAIFTFGIATRKEAKKALHNAETNRDLVETLIAEMDANLAILRACRKSANNILYYLTELRVLFNNTLQYLQHSINYLRYCSMRMTQKAEDGTISITLLPRDLQNRLEATITLAKVLSKLIRHKIVYDEKKLSDAKEEAKKKYDAIMQNKDLKECGVYDASKADKEKYE